MIVKLRELYNTVAVLGMRNLEESDPVAIYSNEA